MNNLLRQSKPVIILLCICAVLIVAVVLLLGVGKNQTSNTTASTGTEIDEQLPGPLPAEQLKAYDGTMTNDNNPIAVIKTNQGTIELELFEDWMPITAGNFIKLAEEGFYNDTKFHRVIEGFMIQGGDPITKTDQVLRYGTGGPDYTITDEFVQADILSNTRGTIAMANNGQPDSGGSQFFINLVDNIGLDYNKAPLTSKHPVFGQVISGMEVVDAIGKLETNTQNLPVEPVIVESITINRN